MAEFITVALVIILALILIGAVLGKLTWDHAISLLIALVITAVLVYWLIGRL